MVLAMSPRQLRGALLLLGIQARHFDRGRILMDLAQIHGIGFDRAEHHASQQTSTIGLEEAVQRPRQHIISVVSAIHQGGIVLGRPLPDGIQGLALDQDVLEEQQDGFAIASLPHGLGEMV